jgi:hypothetical protein
MHPLDNLHSSGREDDKDEVSQVRPHGGSATAGIKPGKRKASPFVRHSTKGHGGQCKRFSRQRAFQANMAELKQTKAD